MPETKHFTFKGCEEGLITADLTFNKSPDPLPIAVFIHGFKGFKDWGAWPLAAQIFAVKGIAFFKFNFSHNGTSPKLLSELKDTEAFGKNTLSMELEECGRVLDFIEKKADQLGFVWDGNIFLIGHSRGGSIALLRAAIDDRVNRVVTWSAMSQLHDHVRMEDPLIWKEKGYVTILNKRSGAELPVNFSFFEDYLQHIELLNMEKQVEKIEQEVLIIHGNADETVPVSNARELYKSIPQSVLLEIENGDHTYKTSHPLTEKKISLAFARVIDETIEFLLM